MKRHFSLFRLLICLAVCVGLILGCFPTKTEAVAIETTVAIGVVACLILMSVGVVFNPKTIEDVNAIGQNFQLHMYQWGTSAEKLDEVQDWFNGLSLHSPDDDEWSPNKTKIRLARGILTGISLWCASFMLGKNQVEKEGEAVPDGFALYNGAKMPDIDTVRDSARYPYAYIYWSEYYKSYVLVYFEDIDKDYCYDLTPDISVNFSYHYPSRKYSISDDSWALLEDNSDSNSIFAEQKEIFWTNFNIYTDESRMGLLYPASDPVYTQTEIVAPSVNVGDICEELQKGNISDEELPLYDLNYGTLLPDPAAPLESVQDLGDMLVAGTLTLDEYLEMGQAADPGAVDPVWVQDIPLGSALEYEQNSVAEQVEVLASVDDGGTITYEWHRYGTDPEGNVYPVDAIQTGPVFIPSTEEIGTSYYHCVAYNTSPSGLVSFRVASNTLAVTVVPATATEPDTGTDVDTNQDLADKVGSSVSDALDQSSAKEEQKLNNTGSDASKELLDAIPDYSSAFLPAIRDLSDALGYTGTSCILTMPAITVPAVSDLFSETRILDEQQINFEEYFNKMPEILMTLTRALFDMAVVFFCVREFNHIMQQVMTGFKTPGDKWEEL